MMGVLVRCPCGVRARYRLTLQTLCDFSCSSASAVFTVVVGWLQLQPLGHTIWGTGILRKWAFRGKAVALETRLRLRWSRRQVRCL